MLGLGFNVWIILFALELCTSLEILKDTRATDPILQKIWTKVREIETSMNKNCKEQKKIKGNAKVADTYVRWGRWDCPNGTEYVYDGFAAGSNNNYYGASAHFLCLVRKPSYGKYYPSASNQAALQGVEYKINSGINIPGTPFDKTKYNDHDVPCVVCRTSGRPTSIMIPGTKRCEGGWHMEYRGYLMGGSLGEKSATQYICVDKHPQVLNSGRLAKSGARLYPVEGICSSSLQCPPYIHGAELTCVVCSK